MPELEIRSFVDRDGRVPFQTWVDSLDAQAKTTVALASGTKRRRDADITAAKARWADYKQGKATRR